MGTELRTVNFDEMAMTPDVIRKQVNLIQETMKAVMKDGEHYGIIPGCGKKPTLLKPGAEKLSTTFRLAPSYDIVRTELPGGHREYEIVCTLTHMPTDQIVGQGVGLCTSMESKYRWRESKKVCPTCGAEAIIKGKAEFGGGWLCWARKDGCGAKFKDGDQAIEGQKTGRSENEDIADIFNTVLKIGKKRAHVDAVLTATAASDIFTQDVEDIKPQSTSAEPKKPKKESLTTDQMRDGLALNPILQESEFDSFLVCKYNLKEGTTVDKLDSRQVEWLFTKCSDVVDLYEDWKQNPE